ncbi:tyrosine-type recombinase/integrase [Leisingera aquaemixtae]|uniref:tyrosine-type recombinase/integrase n=1 Tax=Leisingera aquaemixtae TaxID=1396826 RepID=UPI003983FD6E
MSRRRNPYPGVSKATDRHGKIRWRFRAKGSVSQYLPGPYGSADFVAAYEAAKNGAIAPLKTPAEPHGSVAWVIARYLGSDRYRDLSESRRRTLRLALDWLRDQAGPLPFAKFKGRHVVELMKRKEGPSAANAVRKNFSMLWHYAQNDVEGLGMKLGENPARHAPRRKEASGGYHTWTQQEMTQFLNTHGTGTKARLVFLLALNTGMARADLVMLSRGNIKDGTIRYDRQKTGVGGVYPLSVLLMEELARLPSDQFMLISHGRAYKPYKPETLGNWFKDRVREAGLPHCSLHGIRKGQATAIAEHGGTENELMAFLAHSTPDEARRYVRAANRKRLTKSALSRLDGTNPEQVMSNLLVRLDNITSQMTELKGKR